jgi:hypothetical protein
VVSGKSDTTFDMHRPIKKFSMTGTVASDADFIRIREQYEKLLVTDMRDDGCVPVLGLGPLWSTLYDEEEDNYSFELTIYGISVGRKKSLEIEGMDVSGNLIRRSTPPDKSKKSSRPAESK